MRNIHFGRWKSTRLDTIAYLREGASLNWPGAHRVTYKACLGVHRRRTLHHVLAMELVSWGSQDIHALPATSIPNSHS
jgi:hypothetical protein